MKSQRNNGFTLLEVLIVVAIISILAVISISVMTGALQRTRLTACLANRRALLAEASITAMLDEEDVGDAFSAVYQISKNKYPCPDGGTYSWDGQRIVCDKHPDSDGGQTPAVRVGDGQFQIQLDPGVDTVQYKKNDYITVTKGKIFQIGDKYYVGVDNFTPRKVSSDQYEQWLKNSYMVKEISFDKHYTQADLGTGGLLNGYSGNAPVGVGSVYSFGGKLYIQNKTFSGNTPTQSSDPTVNTAYWTLMGTLA